MVFQKIIMNQLSGKLNKLTHAQRERLAHIEFTLMFKGEAGRNYLTERFKVAPSVVTQDFARYRELAPHNVEYDDKQRLHLKTDKFSPIFEYDIVRTLATLSQGFGDGFLGKSKPPMACEAPYHLNKPHIDIVATLSEAIHKKIALTIEYVSLSNGKSRRVIIPHTLIDNGLRWHVRAFDRKQGRFIDFVLTRIKNAALLDANNNKKAMVDEDSELIVSDKQWSRIVELELIPHPQITHPEAVELDYAMSNGSINIELRAAVTGYVLRLWNIDCSPDHSLTGEQYHLALKNPETLYGVDNAKLSPGFISNGSNR